MKEEKENKENKKINYDELKNNLYNNSFLNTYPTGYNNSNFDLFLLTMFFANATNQPNNLKEIKDELKEIKLILASK